MASIAIGENSALWIEHQFAACGNSCRVFGKLVFDEETSTLFLESDAECFQLSVKLSSLASFMCLTTLQKR